MKPAYAIAIAAFVILAKCAMVAYHHNFWISCAFAIFVAGIYLVFLWFVARKAKKRRAAFRASFKSPRKPVIP